MSGALEARDEQVKAVKGPRFRKACPRPVRCAPVAVPAAWAVHGPSKRPEHALTCGALDVPRLLQVNVLAEDVLHLDAAHRCVRRADRRAVDVLPLGIAGGGLEQPLLLIVGEHPADGCALGLAQHRDVVLQRGQSP